MSPETNGPFVNLLSGIEDFDSRLKRERAIRVENGGRGVSFGVSFLDDALGGIFPNDLIVIGAKTGLGKSQLAMLIALANARAKKRVHFFALEAEEYEIERRVKFQLLSDKYYRLPAYPVQKLNYLDWYYGRYDKELAFLEEEIESEAPLLPTLKTYYRKGKFDCAEFERLFLGIKEETDLVIVDHLHYFDTDDDNENRAVKAIVKKIRDCALIAGKPVILIAHVRKSDRRAVRLIPDIEDFHGSSDIGKIATKAITIAPAHETASPIHRNTYFQILKCRVDGTRMRGVAMSPFNFHTQRYENEYTTGTLDFEGTEFTPDGMGDVPRWAVNAKQLKQNQGVKSAPKPPPNPPWL